MVRIGIAKAPIFEDDWCIIELQGTLNIRDLDPALTRNNQLVAQHFCDKYLGDIHYLKQKGQCILIVGHHVLHGKEKILEKPFAVTERIGRAKYQVKAIVKRKLVFSTRPQPIIIEVVK